MREMKNSLYIVGMIFSLIGGVFTLLGLAFLAAYGNGGSVTLVILFATFGGMGSVFLSLGLVFYLPARKKLIRNAWLKSTGARYEAEIIRFTDNYMLRVDGYPSAYAECSYVNENGEVCLVKSGMLLLGIYRGKDELRAAVYVNRDDPRDYYVEITPADGGEVKFDKDYR